MLIDNFIKNVVFQQFKHFHRDCMQLTHEANTIKTLKIDRNSRRRVFASKGKVSRDLETGHGICKSQKVECISLIIRINYSFLVRLCVS